MNVVVLFNAFVYMLFVYNKHLCTQSHIDKIALAKKKAAETTFKCICGKTYAYQSGLSKHKGKCNNIKQNIKTIVKDEEQEIIQLEKDIQKLENDLASINTIRDNCAERCDYLDTNCRYFPEHSIHNKLQNNSN